MFSTFCDEVISFPNTPTEIWPEKFGVVILLGFLNIHKYAPLSYCAFSAPVLNNSNINSLASEAGYWLLNLTSISRIKSVPMNL